MERTPANNPDRFIIALGADTELRPVEVADAREFHAVIRRNQEHLGQWLAWATPDYSVEDSRRFTEERAEQNSAGTGLTLAIRHHGALCGAIELHRFDERNKSTSLGYWLDSTHVGKGIATRACHATVTTGFSDFGLHRIEIRCATWNHRSSAVPRRLGFVEEAVLREAEFIRGGWVDLRVFGMLAQDWPGSSQK